MVLFNTYINPESRVRAIGRLNLIESHSIAMVPADRNFLDPMDDEYAGSASRSLMRYLSVAAIVSLQSRKPLNIHV